MIGCRFKRPGGVAMVVLAKPGGAVFAGGVPPARPVPVGGTQPGGRGGGRLESRRKLGGVPVCPHLNGSDTQVLVTLFLKIIIIINCKMVFRLMHPV